MGGYSYYTDLETDEKRDLAGTHLVIFPSFNLICNLAVLSPINRVGNKARDSSRHFTTRMGLVLSPQSYFSLPLQLAGRGRFLDPIGFRYMSWAPSEWVSNGSGPGSKSQDTWFGSRTQT